MVQTLYGLNKCPEDKHDLSVTETEAKKAFKSYVQERKEIEVNYASWTLYTRILPYLCCIKSCCARHSYLKSKMDRYKKFEIAI